MNSFSLLIAVMLISSGYFFLGTRSSKAVRTAGARLHSLPHYYGLFAGLVAALREQAGKLWHTSNLYRIPGQERVAAKLAVLTEAPQVAA